MLQGVVAELQRALPSRDEAEALTVATFLFGAALETAKIRHGVLPNHRTLLLVSIGFHLLYKI